MILKNFLILVSAMDNNNTTRKRTCRDPIFKEKGLKIKNLKEALNFVEKNKINPLENDEFINIRKKYIFSSDEVLDNCFKDFLYNLFCLFNDETFNRMWTLFFSYKIQVEKTFNIEFIVYVFKFLRRLEKFNAQNIIDIFLNFSIKNVININQDKFLKILLEYSFCFEETNNKEFTKKMIFLINLFYYELTLYKSQQEEYKSYYENIVPALLFNDISKILEKISTDETINDMNFNNYWIFFNRLLIDNFKEAEICIKGYLTIIDVMRDFKEKNNLTNFYYTSSTLNKDNCLLF